MEGSRIIAVRVAYPGTAEQHITDFKMETGNEINKPGMVLYVQMNPNTYYTYEAGKKAFLEVARTQDGVPYVRTNPDSTIANNLLNLPRF
ncbi:DUF3892 domain-containing protein [Paenibacillus sp. FSL K6-0108]|uniref:DUF3892 domain-containing protein n=1 Tax=Paenibacillus sp. FSL K6-0108 TaxID=2921417 RepID=UPI00325676C4